jgi:predicted MFS family arabinose efflux permease
VALLSNIYPPFRGILGFGLVFFFLGSTLSGIRLGYYSYMLDVSPEAERPTYLGFMNTFIAPALLLSAVGGFVIERTSFEFLFFTVIAAGVIALAFSIQLEEPRRRPAE